MLDQLINLVRQHAGSGIINNSAIPNEKNDQAVETAGSSIMATLQNALAGGRINDLLSFFNNGATSTSNITQEATNNYAQDLQAKVGLDATAATAAATQVVPQTMQQLASKTADPSDGSFNIQEIFNSLSGGKTNGLDLQRILNNFAGGKFDKDGDGDVDLQDLKSMFSGAGGLMDKVKGMFN